MSLLRTTSAAILLACCTSGPQSAAVLAEDGAKTPPAGERLALNKALNLAAALGQTGKVKELLGRGADIQWRDPDNNGKTPLVLAVLHGRFETVKVLLESGADIHHPDGSGRYPIYFCCIGTNVELLNYLLAEGGSADLDRGPFPVLVSLCDHGQAAPEFIPILVKAGVDPDEFKGPATALIAALQLDPKVRRPAVVRGYVKALIENGADVNLRDKGKEKLTPLGWARRRGDQEVIDMLVKAGAKE